jgi:hypothetical protein
MQEQQHTGMEWLINSYTHFSTAIAYLFVAYLYYLRRTDLFGKIAIIALVACWCDNYAAVFFLLPIILENIYYYYKTKRFDKRVLLIVCGMTLVLLRKYALPGDIFMHYIATERAFTQYGELPSRFMLVFHQVLTQFNADFFGIELKKALPKLISFAIFAVALWRLMVNIHTYIYQEQDHNNRFLGFIALSISVVFLAWIFSSLAIDGGRYASGIVLNLWLLLLLWLSGRKWSANIIFFAFFIYFGIYTGIKTHKISLNNASRITELKELVVTIEKEGLKYGYAGYATANQINFYSDSHNLVVTLGNNFVPCSWNSNCANVRNKPVNYIVVSKTKRVWTNLEANDAQYKQIFGEPSKIIELNNWDIYVYDYDLSEKVKINRKIY